MPKSYGQLPLSGSIIIDVPRKLLRFDKNDRVVLYNTLTPTKNIAGGNLKTIKLKPIAGNKTIIESQGLLRPSDKKSREELSNKINKKMDKIEMKGTKKSIPKK